MPPRPRPARRLRPVSAALALAALGALAAPPSPPPAKAEIPAPAAAPPPDLAPTRFRVETSGPVPGPRFDIPPPPAPPTPQDGGLSAQKDATPRLDVLRHGEGFHLRLNGVPLDQGKLVQAVAAMALKQPLMMRRLYLSVEKDLSIQAGCRILELIHLASEQAKTTTLANPDMAGLDGSGIEVFVALQGSEAFHGLSLAFVPEAWHARLPWVKTLALPLARHAAPLDPLQPGGRYPFLRLLAEPSHPSGLTLTFCQTILQETDDPLPEDPDVAQRPFSSQEVASLTALVQSMDRELGDLTDQRVFLMADPRTPFRTLAQLQEALRKANLYHVVVCVRRG